MGSELVLDKPAIPAFVFKDGLQGLQRVTEPTGVDTVCVVIAVGPGQERLGDIDRFPVSVVAVSLNVLVVGRNFQALSKVLAKNDDRCLQLSDRTVIASVQRHDVACPTHQDREGMQEADTRILVVGDRPQ